MTKKLRFKVFSLIFALFVAIYATGAVFAWFTVNYRDLDMGGKSKGAYFAYGDGSEFKKDSNGNEIGEGKTGNKDDWDTSSGPFGITNAFHMFNLAWLQNNGFFDDKQFYFELGDDVDMMDDEMGKNVVIPPIGNKEHPFKGVFDGQRKTISNLVVSTNKNVLYGKPAAPNYSFSNAVGLFGMTAGVEESKTYIGNFILDYPTVEVADAENGTYTNVDTKYENEDAERIAVGLAVGYVSDNVQVHTIGVRGGTLAVRRRGYQTFNSILGNLSEKAQGDHNITGSGSGVGGSGNQFGANFDTDGIWKRMGDIYENGGVSHRLPNVTLNKDGGYSLSELEKIPFTITSASTYEGADAAEVVSPNNVGYILGDKDEAVSKKVKFGPPLSLKSYNVGGSTGKWCYPDENGNLDESLTPESTGMIPQWFYEPAAAWKQGEYTTGIIKPISEETYNEISQDIKDYIFSPDKDGSYTLNSIQLGGLFSNNTLQIYSRGNGVHNTGSWTPHGMIEWGGNAYGQAYERNGYAADENGYYYDGDNTGGNGYKLSGLLMDDDLRLFKYNSDGSKNYTGGTGKRVPIWGYEEGIALPNNGIWFRPVNTGKIRIVLYTDADSSKNEEGGAHLLKLQRPAAQVQATGNLFAINWDSGRDSGNGGVQIITNLNYTLMPNILYYFEFDVQQSDLDAGYEYWICQANGANVGAKFVFLDIGSSASVDDGIDTDKADKDRQLTEIDFIYKNVTILDHDIKDNDGNVLIPKGTFVTGNSDETYEVYVESATMLKFGGNGAIVCFYYRQDNQPDDNSRTIYGAYKATENSLISSIENKASITTNIPSTWPDLVDGDHQYNGWTLNP